MYAVSIVESVTPLQCLIYSDHSGNLSVGPQYSDFCTGFPCLHQCM